MLAFYEWCSKDPINNVLYIYHSGSDRIDRALSDYLRTTIPEDRIISAVDDPHVHLNYFLYYKPKFISSYPAIMRSLAMNILKKRKSFDSVKLIHTTSETLDNHTKNLLHQAFPKASIYQSYATTEAGNIAYECPSRQGYHIFEDNCIVEIDQGNIIVTDLINQATPIIRYQGLGDLAHWNKESCSCPNSFRKFTGLDGRTQDSVYLPNGTTIPPFPFKTLMEDIKELYKYQITQEDYYDFKVLIVPDETSHLSRQTLLQKINAGFGKIMHHKVRCDVQYVSDIEPPAGLHKVPLVQSKVKE
ncbi:MAG: hypothetical protein HYS98_09135, partial [Deltaproteobacteria bacterium]|nr:hypothetical protein [Deltaproteobacteria bacterium]